MRTVPISPIHTAVGFCHFGGTRPANGNSGKFVSKFSFSLPRIGPLYFLSSQTGLHVETQLLVHSDSLMPVLWPSLYRVQTFTGGWGAFFLDHVFPRWLIYERETREKRKDRCAVPGSRSFPEAWTVHNTSCAPPLPFHPTPPPRGVERPDVSNCPWHLYQGWVSIQFRTADLQCQMASLHQGWRACQRWPQQHLPPSSRYKPLRPGLWPRLEGLLY